MCVFFVVVVNLNIVPVPFVEITFLSLLHCTGGFVLLVFRIVIFILRYIYCFLIFSMVLRELTLDALWTHRFVSVINALLLNFIWTFLCWTLWYGAGPWAHFPFASCTNIRLCQQRVLKRYYKAVGGAFHPCFGVVFFL